MGTRYWAKIDDGVEGPYEPQVLKFIDGFSPDILVSPDTPDALDAEEAWVRVVEVPELQALLNRNSREGPVPKVIEAPLSVPTESNGLLETIEEDWGFEPTPAPPPSETVPDMDKTLELHNPKPPVEAPEDFITSADMLDLMEQISKEVGKPPVQISKPEPVQAPVSSAPAVKVPDDEKTHIEIHLGKPVLALAIALLLGGFAYWGIHSGKFMIWKETLASKFHFSSSEKQSEPAQVPAPAEPTEPAAQQAVQTPAPLPAKPAPAVSVKKTARAKKPVEIEAKAPEPTATEGTKEEAEKALESQKFYLPGVPSPNLSDAKVDRNAPLPDAAAQPEQEIKKEDASASSSNEKTPSKESETKPANSNWDSQAGWGN